LVELIGMAEIRRKPFDQPMGDLAHGIVKSGVIHIVDVLTLEGTHEMLGKTSCMGLPCRK
jgi:hypothetical protein